MSFQRHGRPRSFHFSEHCARVDCEKEVLNAVRETQDATELVTQGGRIELQRVARINQHFNDVPVAVDTTQHLNNAPEKVIRKVAVEAITEIWRHLDAADRAWNHANAVVVELSGNRLAYFFFHPFAFDRIG